MTDTQLRAGGVPNPSDAIVSADQQTILGDGTTENPLRLASDPQEFDAGFVPDLPLSPAVGMLVRAIDVDPDPDDGGIATVAPADANSDGFPLAVGVVVAVDGAPTIPVVTVKGSGQVTLTTGQWDARTGQVGGLTRGAPYFLRADVVGGLNPTAPVGSGDFVAQVGIALNTTTLLLSLPAVPIENP